MAGSTNPPLEGSGPNPQSITALAAFLSLVWLKTEFNGSVSVRFGVASADLAAYIQRGNTAVLTQLKDK